MKQTLPKPCGHGRLKSKCNECAIRILKYHNAWRRGSEFGMMEPALLGQAIDLVVKDFESKQKEGLKMNLVMISKMTASEIESSFHSFGKEQLIAAVSRLLEL